MNEPWKDVRSAHMSCEAVKMSLTHNKDGYFLRLSIQPDDIPDGLLRAPVGSRYEMVFVEKNDDETPKVPPAKRKADRLVAAAGMMCREPRFWDYLDSIGLPRPVSEAEAVEVLHDYLGIGSRSELVEQAEARAAFDGMKGEFESWMR